MDERLRCILLISALLLVTFGVSALVVGIVYPDNHLSLASSTVERAIHNTNGVGFFCAVIPMSLRLQNHFSVLVLGWSTVSLSILVGLTCTFTGGIITLAAASVTAVLVVFSIFYAVKVATRDYDSQFLLAFLFWTLMAFISFDIVLLCLQISHPIKGITAMIVDSHRTITSMVKIVHNMNNLINRSSDDNYNLVQVNFIYLDIINLFLHLLKLFGSAREQLRN